MGLKNCIDCGKPLRGYYAKRCSHCSKVGNLSNLWKGDNVGYTALHFWMKSRFPKTKFCQNCNKVPPKDLANISGEYIRDISDWKWLCRKCHMTEDGRIYTLKERLLKSSRDIKTGRFIKEHIICSKCNKQIDLLKDYTIWKEFDGRKRIKKLFFHSSCFKDFIQGEVNKGINLIMKKTLSNIAPMINNFKGIN